MHYASSRRRSRACSACAVSRAPQQCHLASASVTETTSRRSRRPRGGALAEPVEESSAGARRRRRASLLLPVGGRDGPSLRAECGPGDTACGPGHSSPTPSRSGRRPRVAARSWLVGCSESVREHKTQEHRGARVDAGPEPTDAVGVVEVARGERGPRTKGKGSVRTTKPAPSEYPHATALANLRARQNPHVLPPGFGSTHPKGGSIGFGYWVIRGGCAKEMKRAELAQ